MTNRIHYSLMWSKPWIMWSSLIIDNIYVLSIQFSHRVKDLPYSVLYNIIWSWQHKWRVIWWYNINEDCVVVLVEVRFIQCFAMYYECIVVVCAYIHCFNTLLYQQHIIIKYMTIFTFVNDHCILYEHIHKTYSIL